MASDCYKDRNQQDHRAGRGLAFVKDHYCYRNGHMGVLRVL